MSWFKDSAGNVFTTTDGKQPGAGATLTNQNGTSGTYTGGQFVPNK